MTVMTSNPLTVTIPANCQGEISAISNAAYLQKVTITAGDINGAFSGTGEGVSMTLANNTDSLAFPAISSTRYCTLYFQYSDAPGHWHDAVVNSPVIVKNGPFTTITVTSEDASDHDNNDTLFTIFCYTVSSLQTTSVLPKEIHAKSEAGMTLCSHSDLSLTGAIAVGTPGWLELHAKTYYTNPNIQGGDETYIQINISQAGSGSDHQISGTGSSTGFANVIVQAWDMRDHNPLWNYISVAATLTDCRHENMEGTYMVITTWFRYWTSPPTTYSGPDWTAALYNSPYQVSRVTP